MRKLFVPVDFSTNAYVALRYAAHLAKAIGGVRLTAHFMVDEDSFNNEEHRNNHLERLSDFIEHALKKENLGEGLQSDFSISPGSRLSELVHHPDCQSSDLIVMGTKGANSLIQKLRGSNTYEVVKASKKPVLVVPGHASFRPYRNLLYCSDFDEMESLDGLVLVKQLAQLFNSTIRIAHVKISREKPSAERKFESERQAGFFSPEVEHSFKIIRHKTVSDGLQYYIKLKSDNDLVVMVKRHHGMLEELFMKNHTREMVFHTHLPLLVIGGK
jgi:nucleotide-binding universal stress UspA family protein